MRYPASEKLEIIRIVEQSHQAAKRTLDQLGIPRRTFYRWYDRFLEGGPEALEDRPSAPSRVWNRIGDDIQDQIIEMALKADATDLRTAMTGHDGTGNSRSIFDAASAWHVAASRDDMDWEGFMAWLAADPRHRSAYDQIALADSLVEEHRDDFHTHDVRQAGRWRRPLTWGAGLTAAAAASLIAFFAAPHFLSAPTATYQTFGAAEQVALDDGSTVLLAPRSRLVVTGGPDEKIELSGGAWFDIRHDAARSLAITAGQVKITDIGTRFDVQATDGQVRVAVAEGEVQVASSSMAQPVHLQPGEALLFDGEGGSAAVSKLAIDAVGQWRQGRVTYEETPLSLVIADLARYSGIQVEIGRALRGRLFSGTLVVGNGEAALRDLSQLMGLELRRSRSGYRLDERGR